jgi:two-component system sensor histidine kinase RegB
MTPTPDTLNEVNLQDIGLGFTLFFSVLASVWFITQITNALQKYITDLSGTKEATLHDEWVVYMGGIAAGAAHELSTPISTLCTLVESIQKQSDPIYVSHKDLELMKNQLSTCRQALALLNQKFCLFSHDEQYVNIDAFDWFSGLAFTYKSLNPAATITTEFCSNLLGLKVKFDISLKQAIQNLLDNAVAAEAKGILLAACCHDCFLQIRIVDHGPGIRSETLERLKQRLPQQSAQGLGLGLILAKNTIERYSGSLEFTTFPQGGTEVTVELPLNKVCTL